MNRGMRETRARRLRTWGAKEGGAYKEGKAGADEDSESRFQGVTKGQRATRSVQEPISSTEKIMPLGVLNNISAIYAENNLNQTQAALQNTLTQLSSGSRINSGADDSAGLAIANGLQANSSALTQSSANATSGVGFLQVADGALSQVTNLLNRAVTLATEAGGGTLSSSQMSAADQEYQDILTQIGTIGSTTEYNGLTVFSAASNAATSSLTFTGGTNPSVPISGGGAPVALGAASGAGTTASPYQWAITAGDTLSGSITVHSTGGTVTPLNSVLSLANYQGLASSNQATATAAAASLQAQIQSDLGSSGSTYTVSDFAGALKISSNDVGNTNAEAITISANTAKQSAPLTTTLTLGTNLTGNLVINDTGDGASQSINVVTAGLTGLSSATQGTETAAATILQNLLNNAVTGLKATTGATYTVSDTAGALSISTGSQETLTTTGSTLEASTPVSVTLGSNDTLSGSILINSTGGSVGSSSQTINLASYQGLTSSVAATQNAAISALQTALNTGSGLAASGSAYTVAVNSNVLTISTNGSDAMAITPTAAQESTQISGGMNVYTSDGTSSGSKNYSVTVGSLSQSSVGTSSGSSAAGSSTAYNVTVAGQAGTGGTSAGAGAGTSLTGTVLTTQANAEAALQTVTNAISAVAYQRGQVGANINTLSAASNIASSEQTNITSAQNAITATDYASTTSNMSKFEILTQTGISALAQANSTQQMVTKLLQ